jgi:hypothetical protein
VGNFRTRCNFSGLFEAFFHKMEKKISEVLDDLQWTSFPSLALIFLEKVQEFVFNCRTDEVKLTEFANYNSNYS